MIGARGREKGSWRGWKLRRTRTRTRKKRAGQDGSNVDNNSSFQQHNTISTTNFQIKKKKTPQQRRRKGGGGREINAVLKGPKRIGGRKPGSRERNISYTLYPHAGKKGGEGREKGGGRRIKRRLQETPSREPDQVGIDRDVI